MNLYNSYNYNYKQEDEKISIFTPILEREMTKIPMEYLADIWINLKNFEKNPACCQEYRPIGEKESEINLEMRWILINWIIEIQKFYDLLPEMLHICVSIVDRYISRKHIWRTRLQLVGTAALFIASIYEDLISIQIPELLLATDNAYTKEQVLQMEIEII